MNKLKSYKHLRTLCAIESSPILIETRVTYLKIKRKVLELKLGLWHLVFENTFSYYQKFTNYYL